MLFVVESFGAREGEADQPVKMAGRQPERPWQRLKVKSPESQYDRQSFSLLTLFVYYWLFF